MVGGHIGDSHRGRGGDFSTDKTGVAWRVRRVHCIDLMERILKSVTVRRRIIF